jgi:hypothetical protein
MARMDDSDGWLGWMARMGADRRTETVGAVWGLEVRRDGLVEPAVRVVLAGKERVSQNERWRAAR